MSLGWFEKKSVEKTVGKVIDRIMRNVDQTIEKNPGLKMEEALKIVDRQQGVFFPGDKTDTKDLKSLFALIVWKAYRNIRLFDPDAYSPEHRELVDQLVYDYLEDQNSTEEPRQKKYWKPVAITVCIVFVLILIGVTRPFHSKSPAGFKQTESKNIKLFSSSSENDVFRYQGYASDDYQKLAVINKSIYREGDSLGDNDGYILKSILPERIVILNRRDRSEFSVFMQ